MNKATLQQRILAAADWVERVDESPKFRRAVYLLLVFVISFFTPIIIVILTR